MKTQTTKAATDTALAYLSDEGKRAVAELLTSNDKELELIARLITSEEDYQKLKSLVAIQND